MLKYATVFQQVVHTHYCEHRGAQCLWLAGRRTDVMLQLVPSYSLADYITSTSSYRIEGMHFRHHAERPSRL